jgi:hypothetical protein
MVRTRLACLLVVAGLALPAVAQPPATKPKDTPKPAPAAQPTAPDADTQKMMQAYQEAAKPGKMHEWLRKSAGTWEGKVKSFDDPSGPKESTCTTVNTSMMDGRFMKSETRGQMEMMGQPTMFEGFGLYGFDNATQKFEQAWVDNMGTGIMTGTGELSADGKTLNWTLTYNDPATKAPAAFRQVETRLSDTASTLEMYGKGPDGKEMKMMEIAFTRKGPAPMTPGIAPKTPATAPKK